jgi:uncharacterized protein YutE (UPF0331/DUF86 family)
MNQMNIDFLKTVISKFIDLIKNAKYVDHDKQPQVYLNKEELLTGMPIMMYRDTETGIWKAKDVSVLQLSDIDKLFTWLYTISLEDASQTCIDSYMDLCRCIASRETKIPSYTMNIKNKVTDENENNFIQNVINFLAHLYNETDKNGHNFARCMKKCVEIFWEYGVWNEKKEHSTIQYVHDLLDILQKNPISYASGLTWGVANRFNHLVEYIKSWFYLQAQKQKSTPDINTRVEELEQQVKELQALVKDFIFQHPPELTRQALLKQLARHA